MKKLITSFSRQLSDAIQISRNALLTAAKHELKNVVISGMGGSGIGGDMAAELTASDATVPVLVNKDYTLPGFVNENTLVIISSYSGNTEETVKALEEAITRKAHIVCITSGGKIREISGDHRMDCIVLPDEFPPRAALGYSLVALLRVLNFHGVTGLPYEKQTEAAIALLDLEEKNIVRNAKETAFQLEGKTIVVYGTAAMESVALRFRQQLNENSKLLCWHNVFPELNHNELQGWKLKREDLAVIIFRNQTDYIRTAKRVDISSEIISHYDGVTKEIYSKGNSMLEQMLYLVHWGDWSSYFLAEMKGIDTMDIRVIRYLKSELAKIDEY